MRHNRGPIDYGKYPPRNRVRHGASGVPQAGASHTGASRSGTPQASSARGQAPRVWVTATGKPVDDQAAETSTPFDTMPPAPDDAPTVDEGESLVSEHAAAEMDAWLSKSEQRAATGRRGARKRKPELAHAHRVHDPARAQARAEARQVRAADKKPRRPLWQILRRVCIVLILILGAECVTAALTSPHFAVTAVEISGAKETPAADLAAVREALIGRNWLRAPRAAAKQQAEAIPQIATAQVRHVWAWPPRLAVQITERQPFARVGANENWWVVDESGMPFRPARDDDAGLNAVTGPKLEPEFGKPLPVEAWRPVVQFARVLAQDEQRSGGWSLRRVYFDRHGYASLRLTGGRDDETLVQLGADGWAEKLQTARWALADFAQTGKHAAALNLVSSTVTTWTPRVMQQPENTGGNADATSATASPSEAGGPSHGTPDSIPEA